ncbi:uncharacterized protein LOC142768595 [Rhipicephalus microplus]|uniref:uncharacterized protein LOC142768595 n=1 Tax=Rhipicephalus microplus TaxID=6941 RepID=UPI003F6D62B8
MTIVIRFNIFFLLGLLCLMHTLRQAPTDTKAVYVALSGIPKPGVIKGASRVMEPLLTNRRAPPLPIILGPSTLAKKLMDRVSAKIPAPRPLPPNVASPLGPNSLSTTLQHPKAHIKKVPPPRPPPPRFASKFGARLGSGPRVPARPPPPPPIL